jgi:hypothetical protein
MISPELQRQLNEAKAGEVVVANFSFKDPMPAPGEPTENAVRDLLKRVEASGRPSMVNIFENLGYFVVVGSASFIQMLALQPEVGRAFENSNDRRGR